MYSGSILDTFTKFEVWFFCIYAVNHCVTVSITIFCEKCNEIKMNTSYFKESIFSNILIEELGSIWLWILSDPSLWLFWTKILGLYRKNTLHYIATKSILRNLLFLEMSLLRDWNNVLYRKILKLKHLAYWCIFIC